MIAAGHVKKTRLSSEMEFRHGGGGRGGGKKRLHYEMKKKKKIILQLLKISECMLKKTQYNIKTRGRSVLWSR